MRQVSIGQTGTHSIMRWSIGGVGKRTKPVWVEEVYEGEKKDG